MLWLVGVGSVLEEALVAGRRGVAIDDIAKLGRRLRDGEQTVEQQREDDHDDRPADHLRVVAHGLAVEDVAPEAAEGHVGRDGRGRDDLQRRGAEAADDEAQAVRDDDDDLDEEPVDVGYVRPLVVGLGLGTLLGAVLGRSTRDD